MIENNQDVQIVLSMNSFTDENQDNENRCPGEPEEIKRDMFTKVLRIHTKKYF